MIRDELKRIAQLKDIIKIDDLNYKSKCGKTYNSAKYSLPIAFLRDIHEGYVSLENADFQQSNFALELKQFEKFKKTLEKKSFFK